jgi:hypothetical protein
MTHRNVDAPLRTFYGQVDYLQSNLPDEVKADFDKVLEVLKNVKFSPISIGLSFSGIAICVNAFIRSLQEPNDQLKGLHNRFIRLDLEVTEKSKQANFKTLAAVVVPSSQRIWHLLEKIGKSEETYFHELKKFLGAYITLTFIDTPGIRKTLPSIFHKLSHRGWEGLNTAEIKALETMYLKAQIAFTEGGNKQLDDEVDTFEFYIQRLFRNKIKYADPKARQGAMDYKTLPIPKFCIMAEELRKSCESGNEHSAKVLVASFLGIPFKHVDRLPLIDSGVDDWVLALNCNEGLVKFDLDTIVPGGLQGFGQDYVSGSKILVKPLPEFLRRYLLERYEKNQNPPVNLGELLNQNEPADYTYEVIAKFLNSIARVAINFGEIDPFLADLIANDFRVLPSSKGYYRQTNRKSIWHASTQFFNKVGWGNPVPFVSGLKFGSQAVLTDQAVKDMFAQLADHVKSSKPSNNATVERLLEFHEKYTVYVGVLCMFVLSTRASKRLDIFADEVTSFQRYIIINDKNTHGKASPQPVTINKILQQQFHLYKIHCESLLKRLKLRNCPQKNFIKALQKIALNEHAPLLVTASEPSGVSTTFLTKAIGGNIEANFGRHYWETTFQECGVTSRESAAHLRHQSKYSFNWDGTTDFVLSELIERIDNAQCKKLNELGIAALPGLALR